MLKGNEFRKFFDGNSAYISNYDFTAVVTNDSRLVTLTGLPFTLSEEAVVGGICWNITQNELVPNEDITITTAPSVTITFNDIADDNVFTTGDKLLLILNGPNRLSSSGGINSAVVAGEDAGTSTDDAVLIAGFDGTNFRLLSVNTSGELILASYSSSSNAERVEEINSLNQQYVYEETELTNIASGTTGYIYFDFDGFKSSAIQTIISGAGTLTYYLEATCQNDGTAPASCTYQDVTTDLAGSASFTASDIHFLDTTLPVKYLRLKYVTTVDVTNLTVYSKKLY